jgi:glycosyltransferase involved in cell wall biosynthesis
MFPKWKLVFAGNGEIAKAQSLAIDHRISEQVEFLGWVNGVEKDAVFQEANIFCLPSYAEGFPMAVLDAWSYGLPVITTPVGGLPDILEDGVNSLVFVPGDIQELSKCLKLLIENPELKTKISKKSLELSEEYFSVSKITQRLDSIYTKLIEK